MSIEIPPWSGAELDVMRVGLGFVVLRSLAGMQRARPSGRPPYPIGIARVHDMTWGGSSTTARRLLLGTYAATLLYVGDLLVPVALLYLSAVVVLEVTFRNSWGGVNHGDNLLAVVLCAQTAAVLVWNAAERWSWDLGGVLAGSQDATAAWWAVQSIVAVYFTSGLSKLINTHGRWIHRSPGLLLSALARVDIDRLRGGESWGASGRSLPLVSWLMERPTVCRWLFAAGLLMELVAPLGLLDERLLLAVGVGLLALHRANGHLLGLPFVEYQLLVLIYLVNLPQLVR